MTNTLKDRLLETSTFDTRKGLKEKNFNVFCNCTKGIAKSYQSLGIEPKSQGHLRTNKE